MYPQEHGIDKEGQHDGVNDVMLNRADVYWNRASQGRLFLVRTCEYILRIYPYTVKHQAPVQFAKVSEI